MHVKNCISPATSLIFIRVFRNSFIIIFLYTLGLYWHRIKIMLRIIHANIKDFSNKPLILSLGEN